MPLRLCPARAPWSAARPCAVAGNLRPRLRVFGSAPARPCRFNIFIMASWPKSTSNLKINTSTLKTHLPNCTSGLSSTDAHFTNDSDVWSGDSHLPIIQLLSYRERLIVLNGTKTQFTDDVWSGDSDLPIMPVQQLCYWERLIDINGIMTLWCQIMEGTVLCWCFCFVKYKKAASWRRYYISRIVCHILNTQEIFNVCAWTCKLVE